MAKVPYHFKPNFVFGDLILSRTLLQALALTKSPEPELMFEGQEKGSFWEELGGKQDYFTDMIMREDDEDIEPRLFQLSRCCSYDGND